MNENHLEIATLDWLASVGWVSLQGEVVSPGGEEPARAAFSDVVLRTRLSPAVARLNPALSPAEVEEVVCCRSLKIDQQIGDLRIEN